MFLLTTEEHNGVWLKVRRLKAKILVTRRPTKATKCGDKDDERRRLTNSQDNEIKQKTPYCLTTHKNQQNFFLFPHAAFHLSHTMSIVSKSSDPWGVGANTMIPSLTLPHSSDCLCVNAHAFVVGPVPFQSVFNTTTPMCEATQGLARRVHFSNAVITSGRAHGDCQKPHHPAELTHTALTHGDCSSQLLMKLYSQHALVSPTNAHEASFAHVFLVYVQEQANDEHVTLAGFVATSVPSLNADATTTLTLLGAICFAPEFQMHHFAWNVLQFVKRQLSLSYPHCQTHKLYADQAVEVNICNTNKNSSDETNPICSPFPFSGCTWNFRRDNSVLLELCNLGFRPECVLSRGVKAQKGPRVLIRWVNTILVRTSAAAATVATVANVTSTDTDIAELFPLLVTAPLHTPSTHTLAKCTVCDRNPVEDLDRRARIAVVEALDALLNVTSSGHRCKPHAEILYSDANDPVRYSPMPLVTRKKSSDASLRFSWSAHGLLEQHE